MAAWDTNAKINGETVAAGGNFREAVTKKAAELRYSNFRVLVNGHEVEDTNAPATIQPGANIEVRPYDKAG